MGELFSTNALFFSQQVISPSILLPHTLPTSSKPALGHPLPNGSLGLLVFSSGLQRQGRPPTSNCRSARPYLGYRPPVRAGGRRRGPGAGASGRRATPPPYSNAMMFVWARAGHERNGALRASVPFKDSFFLPTRRSLFAPGGGGEGGSLPLPFYFLGTTRPCPPSPPASPHPPRSRGGGESGVFCGIFLKVL